MQAFVLPICVVMTADLAEVHSQQDQAFVADSEECFAQTVPTTGQFCAIDSTKCVVGHGSPHYIFRQVLQSWQLGCC